MKIHFSALTAAALALLLSTACQREELANGILPGEEVNVTISAVMPSGGPEVKSDEDPGDGSAINRCVLGVYLVNGSTQELYGDVMYEAVNGGTATFEDVALLTGYDYKLVFWADNVAGMSALSTDKHYTVTFGKTTPQVSYKSEGTYTSSDDTRDAFFGVFDLKGFSGTVEDSYTLTRPFGQLNIFTTDYSDIKSEALKPAKVQITFPSIPTGMNLLTGATTSSTAVTGTVSSIPTSITSPVVSGAQQLSFDYIFAPADQQLMLQNIEMAFYDASDSPLQIEPYTFPELPVQRNYRTNVSGALLTKSADLTIEIQKDFAGTEDVNLHEVSTIAEVEETLNEIADMGADVQPESIVFTFSEQLNEADNTIELPALTTEVTLNFDGGISSTGLTVKDDTDDGNFTGKVVISNAGGNAVPLTINLPEGSAELKSGKWSSVDVTTADNTFIVGSDVEIENLTMKKGSLKLYGKITSSLTKAEGYVGTIYRCLSDQTSMDNLILDDKSKYEYILVEESTEELDGKESVFKVPMTISADADLSNFDIVFEKDTYTTNNAIVVEDGAGTVRLSGMKLYSQSPSASLLMLKSSGTNLNLEECELILTKGGKNQSGINVRNGGSGNVLDVVMENSYIGFDSYDNRINQNMDEDYYVEDGSYFGASYSRGFTLGSDPDDVCDGTGRTNIIVRDSYIEGTYYCINTLHNVALDIDIVNSVFDGRAGLNIWTTSDAISNIDVISSKFIGRNTFSGPTEEFATIVFNGQNTNDGGRWVKNTVVTVNGSQICSYNDPQTETNRQYAVQMRSKAKNWLVLSNGTRLRELYSPRLDHLVDLDYWINEVDYDETIKVEGVEGATVLPSNLWDGKVPSYQKVPSVCVDGKYYIGTPADLYCAMMYKKSGDYVLTRDLDLGGYAWKVVDSNDNDDFQSFSFNFDGSGHTIYNLKCETYLEEEEGTEGLAWDNKSQNAGLFGVFNGELKNLTVDGAEIYGSRSGVLVGRLDGGSITNCHVKNAKIIGGAQKMGLLAGYVNAGMTSKLVIDGCTVENSVVNNDQNPPEGDASTMAGGFIGYLQPISYDVLISNNTLTNVKVVSGNIWDGYDECASHIFVGNIINLSRDKICTIEFSGNKLIDCVLENAVVGETSTDYYGFAYDHIIGNYNALSTVIVDGVETIKGQMRN